MSLDRPDRQSCCCHHSYVLPPRRTRSSDRVTWDWNMRQASLAAGTFLLERCRAGEAGPIDNKGTASAQSTRSFNLCSLLSQEGKMAGKTVVVTGANGFIASWIVKQLLERDYIVRGTVRNPDDVSKVGHLLDLPGAKERLTLYKAGLLEEAVFDAVVDGADYVMHTATPVIVGDVEEPEKQVIEPSVEGTMNVLRAAAKSKTVKRVVYTSSTAAVFYSYRFVNITEDDVVDESWWSDPDFCMKERQYYHAGKTLAERALYEFAKDAPFDVVSIMPCNVVGTVLQKAGDVTWSNNEILRLLKGIDRPELRHALVPNTLAYVDVEDVAKAHILAIENPSAEGRYLAAERSINNDQLAVFLAKLYPEYTTVLKPSMEGKDEETFMKPCFKLSNEKLRRLGLNFTPLADTVKKAVQSLQQMNAL